MFEIRVPGIKNDETMKVVHFSNKFSYIDAIFAISLRMLYWKILIKDRL